MAKSRTGPKRILKRTLDKTGDVVRTRRIVVDSKPSAEPDLFSPAAPMPGWIEPCLAALVDKAPVGPRWLHEIKWDGYRLQPHVQNGSANLYTRGGHDWTERFPNIAEAVAALPVTSAILDGEAVVEGENGIPSFSALQAALGARDGPGHKAAHEAVLYAFDLLYLNGRDYREQPLDIRRAALASLLSVSPAGGALRLSDHFEGDGDAFWRHACGMGLEGIISKRRDRPYRSGRGEDWLKIKCAHGEKFVIAGYLPLLGRKRAVGALVLGYYDEHGKLIYAGRTGTGFTAESAASLWAKLQPLRRADAPFPAGQPPGRSAGAVWVKPKLVAEIEFRGWTSDRLLRHASFKGLREDAAGEADAAKRIDEGAVQKPLMTPGEAIGARASAKTRQAVSGVPGENIQRLLSHAPVATIDALAAYWRRVAKAALPYLARRPLTLVRHVNGVTFFHKGPLPPVPASVHQLRIEKREGGEGVRLWVDSLEGLLGLVQIGVIEVHPWGATIEDIEHPDTLVFDLDPGSGVAWDFLTDTALRLCEMLRKEGLEPWPKVTGGKGLHLMVPFDRQLSWERVRALCKGIAQGFAATDPARYTASSTADRAGRIFIDYLRNGRGQTAIGAYSPRARQGFPVAAPVTWRDVEQGIKPDAFTLNGLLRRRAVRP
jgi:bifunctional non-homologous end joining protein LigD